MGKKKAETNRGRNIESERMEGERKNEADRAE